MKSPRETRIASTAETARPLCIWPVRSHLIEAVWLGLAFTFWFALIYGGADWITGLRSSRVRLHSDAELAIPFVPSAVVAYMSVYPLFWLAPFVLPTQRELRAWFAAMCVVTLIGGIGFLLLPSELAWPERNVTGFWSGLFQVADTCNLRYNLAPSLHVALSTVCAGVYARHRTIGTQLGLWVWAGVIAISTLLIHEHHLIDMLSGALVGLLVSQLLYPRWAVAANVA